MKAARRAKASSDTKGRGLGPKGVTGGQVQAAHVCTGLDPPDSSPRTASTKETLCRSRRNHKEGVVVHERWYHMCGGIIAESGCPGGKAYSAFYGVSEGSSGEAEYLALWPTPLGQEPVVSVLIILALFTSTTVLAVRTASGHDALARRKCLHRCRALHFEAVTARTQHLKNNDRCKVFCGRELLVFLERATHGGGLTSQRVMADFPWDVKRYFYALVHLRLVTALGGWFFTLYHW